MKSNAFVRWTTIGFLFCLSFAGTAAQASPVKFGGDSAKFYFSQLSNRAEGVTRGAKKSLLGSAIDTLSLFDVMECQVKHGWVFESYKCQLLDTRSEDIQGRKAYTNETSTDLDNSISDLINSHNEHASLKVGGVSAERLWAKLSKLSSEKGYFTKSGRTRILKNPYEVIGIAEFYCTKTEGRILGTSVKCTVPNVTLSDSNAPSEEIDSSKDSN